MDITADSDIGGNVSDTTNGYDIRFTTDDETTLLKYEREYFNVTAGDATGHFWVSLDGWVITNAATTDIYIYYNDGDGTVDGESATDVWDANFMGVWHMKDITTSTIDDSTTLNDGTKKGANQPIEDTGKIWKGQDFDGGDDFINCGNDASLQISGNITVSCWARVDTDANSDILGKWDGDVTFLMFFVASNNELRFYTGGTSQNNAGRYVSTPGVLYYVTGLYDGSNTKIYINGAWQADAVTPIAPAVSTSDLYMGERSDTSNPLDGMIDEVRISDTNRGVAWIKFEHANMNEGDNELDWAGEESAPAVDGYIPKVIMIT